MKCKLENSEYEKIDAWCLILRGNIFRLFIDCVWAVVKRRCFSWVSKIQEYVCYVSQTFHSISNENILNTAKLYNDRVKLTIRVI